MADDEERKVGEERKECILNTIDDLISDLLYYARKEDRELPRGSIEEAIAYGEITVVEMVERFSVTLRQGLQQ
jgi:hypothetical protein